MFSKCICATKNIAKNPRRVLLSGLNSSFSCCSGGRIALALEVSWTFLGNTLPFWCLTFPAHTRPWATTVAMSQAKGAWSCSHSYQTLKNENNPLERANAASGRGNCKFIIPPRMWNSWMCRVFTNGKPKLDLFSRMEISANSAVVIWRQEKPAAILAPLSSLNICSGKAREYCINILISLNLTKRCSRFRHVSEIHLHPSPWVPFFCSCFSIKLESKNKQYVNTSQVYTHLLLSDVCTETKWKPGLNVVTQDNAIWDKRLVLSFPLKINLAAARVKSSFLNGMERWCSHCTECNLVYGALLQGGDALNPRETTPETRSMKMHLGASSYQQISSPGLRNLVNLKMSQLPKAWAWNRCALLFCLMPKA